MSAEVAPPTAPRDKAGTPQASVPARPSFSFTFLAWFLGAPSRHPDLLSQPVVLRSLLASFLALLLESSMTGELTTVQHLALSLACGWYLGGVTPSAIKGRKSLSPVVEDKGERLSDSFTTTPHGSGRMELVTSRPRLRVCDDS